MAMSSKCMVRSIFELVPTILIVYGYRFFFFSNENGEPVHVHVKKGEGEGKVWLEPTIKAAYLWGFKAQEEKEILRMVEEHRELFKSKWHEHFGN
jgi:hypothetical protein